MNQKQKRTKDEIEMAVKIIKFHKKNRSKIFFVKVISYSVEKLSKKFEEMFALFYFLLM